MKKKLCVKLMVFHRITKLMKANFESIKEIILKEIENDNFEITVDQSVIKRKRMK